MHSLGLLVEIGCLLTYVVSWQIRYFSAYKRATNMIFDCKLTDSYLEKATCESDVNSLNASNSV